MKDWDKIFKAGTHTSSTGATREWTSADLDKLVANIGEDTPIVIHHPADQDKAVNFGKIARLKRVGENLMAQYRDIPEILSMAVKEGLKLAKSVSIDPVTMKIRHIGLLGAGQPPAVGGLGPASFTAVDSSENNGGEPSLTYMFNQNPHQKQKENTVDPKDLKIKELEDQVKSLEGNKDLEKIKQDLEHVKEALEKEKTAHEASKAEFTKHKQELEEEDLAARVTALAESGRIRPVDKDKTLAFAKALPGDKQTMEFSAPDGKKEIITPREMYLRDLEVKSVDQDGLLNEFARARVDHAGHAPASGEGDVFKDINSFA